MDSYNYKRKLKEKEDYSIGIESKHIMICNLSQNKSNLFIVNKSLYFIKLQFSSSFKEYMNSYDYSYPLILKVID